MNWISDVKWDEIFTPDMPFLEIFVRGTLIYLGLFFLLRVAGRRQAGAVGVSDLLLVVLIADAAQNGMAGDYKSVPDGLFLVATLVFWDFTLDWLGFHFEFIERLLSPPAMPLIRKGKMLRRNMRELMVSENGLKSMLHEQGIEKVSEVKRACLEGNGKLSIIKFDKDEKPNKPNETQV